MQLIRYRKDTGQIFGIYEANDQALLEAQQQNSGPDSAWAFLLAPVNAPVHDQAAWAVKDGQLCPRDASEVEAEGRTVRAQLTQLRLSAESKAICTALCAELSSIRDFLDLPALSTVEVEAAILAALPPPPEEGP